MEPKPFYFSKTVIVNVLTGLAAFLALPELSTVLGPDALRWIILVQAGINIALRFVTSSAVTVTR